MNKVRVLIALAFVAIAARLVEMTFLHPLNWDEVEFFRASDFVRQGLVPYRDFWEHHTPLQWFLFAPFTAMTQSPGAAAVIFMRWVQVALWIAAFWLVNVWMTSIGIGRFARWAANAAAVCSSLLMLAAVEYRVDVLGCALYIAGIVLMQRMRDSKAAAFGAGMAFCLAGLANLRLGPLLAATAALALVIDIRESKWRVVPRAFVMYAGVIVTLGMATIYSVSTDSLAALYRFVWVDNYIGDRFNTPVPWAFAHRLLVPFGIRIYGGPGSFQLSGVDLSGAIIVAAGFIGMARALSRWRTPGHLFQLAVLQLVSLLFLAKMAFVYHYHFEIVVLMMLPFVATEIERFNRERLVIAVAAVACMLNIGFAMLRGKEDDFAYQDLIMREVDARTAPGATVFDGVGWALRRRPFYRFWFLPELIRKFSEHGYVEPLRVSTFVAAPPAAIITDRNAAVWLAQHPDLGVYAVTHYLPLWRNLWLPGLSARLTGTHPRADWMVPIDGLYRVFASSALANDPWFRQPLAYGVARPPVEFSGPGRGANATIVFSVNGQPVTVSNGVLALRARDRVSVAATAGPAGVFLIPGNETIWFRQPPPGVTLDAEGGRVTHWPVFRNVFSAPTPTSSARP